MDFTKAMGQWTKQVSLKMDNIFKDVVILVGESVVRISPVDTGLFRGNWQLTVDGEESNELNRLDPTGGAALASITSRAQGLKAGQIAYILNHLEYGYDLEYGAYNGPTAKVTEQGFSRQAPEGMLRVTEARFISIVEEAIRLNP